VHHCAVFRYHSSGLVERIRIGDMADAVYNGTDATSVRHWPAEYSSFGVGTRIIMRPTGAREYVVHDHLGSARLTLDNTGQIVESRSYRAFGEETQSDGVGARTSHIGREKDNESDLGFYGVRMYEPTYGRFLSVDPLWMKYLPLQPYHYAGNDPVAHLDFDGREIRRARGQSKEQFDLFMKFYNAAIDHYECSGVPWAASLLRAVKDAPSEEVLVYAELTPNNTLLQLPVDVDGDGKRDAPIGYLPSRNKLSMNFTLGAVFDNGSASPFDILTHEVIHAWLSQTDTKRTEQLMTAKDVDWTNLHEREVIVIFESMILRARKQLRDPSKPSRSSHGGNYVPVCGPAEVPSSVP
jgi:RHS repeat-associated protein